MRKRRIRIESPRRRGSWSDSTLTVDLTPDPARGSGRRDDRSWRSSVAVSKGRAQPARVAGRAMPHRTGVSGTPPTSAGAGPPCDCSNVEGEARALMKQWWHNRWIPALAVAAAIAAWPACSRNAGAPDAQKANLDFVLKNIEGEDVRLG